MIGQEIRLGPGRSRQMFPQGSRVSPPLNPLPDDPTPASSWQPDPPSFPLDQSQARRSGGKVSHPPMHFG